MSVLSLDCFQPPAPLDSQRHYMLLRGQYKLKSISSTLICKELIEQKIHVGRYVYAHNKF